MFETATWITCFAISFCRPLSSTSGPCFSRNPHGMIRLPSRTFGLGPSYRHPKVLAPLFRVRDETWSLRPSAPLSQRFLFPVCPAISQRVEKCFSWVFIVNLQPTTFGRPSEDATFAGAIPNIKKYQQAFLVTLPGSGCCSCLWT